MQQRFVKAGLVLVGNYQNIVQVAVERFAELFIRGDVLAIFVQIHGRFGERLFTGIIFQRYFAGKSNHGIASGALCRMCRNVLLDSQIVAHCVSAAVCYDHCLALAVDLIAAVFQKVCHDHLGFLGDGVAVLLVILEQCAGGLPFDQLRVVLRHTDQLECLLDGGVVGQHIQNIMLLDGLPHGVHMERCLDGFAIRLYTDLRAEVFDGLPLRSCSKGKERLVLVPTLTDDLVDIIIGQIYIFFRNPGLGSVFPSGNIHVDQAAAERFCTLAVLSLMGFINDDGKLASTEDFHVFLGKKELLDSADDDALFIVDGFGKGVGVLLLVNGFHQSGLMLKAVDGVL